ncbi:MAG: Dabb family protein [Anaerolineae bacterium]|uniref:Dabb family protein n=1 Tax=Promineifilum sp. TaxID=2664178 RepID=UPI001DB4F980|nr:Dabb family protein [Anaerolineales bacterium]MCB8935956.1 Dabb family protein [Promineifilum sp.]MCO5180104.1 Dabb family protein [Promineifilum sp.]MCW5847462.1 Dabb family protein [Anaerolineae bacterium]
MLTHIVLIRLKDRRPERIADTRAQLLSLAHGIETLRELEVGTDITHSERSYDLALITRFDDRAGFEIYRQHPMHVPVLAHMAEAAESTVAVDYED